MNNVGWLDGLRQTPQQMGGGQIPGISSGMAIIVEYQALTISNEALGPPKPSVDDSARV